MTPEIILIGCNMCDNEEAEKKAEEGAKTGIERAR